MLRESTEVKPKYFYILEYHSHELARENGSIIFKRKEDAVKFERLQKNRGYQCYLHRRPIPQF